MAVKKLYYSRLMAKEREAVIAFSVEMKKYGLEAESYVAGYFNQNQTFLQAELETKWMPVKGNARILRRLKEDGWHYTRHMGTGTIGDDRLLFRVHGYCDIPVEPDDLLEYTGPQDIEGIGHLQIRKERKENES